MGRPRTNPARPHRGSEGLRVVLITVLMLHFWERFSKRRGSRITKPRSSRCTSSTALLFPRLIDFFHPFEINKPMFSFTAILACVCFLHRSPATWKEVLTTRHWVKPSHRKKKQVTSSKPQATKAKAFHIVLALSPSLLAEYKELTHTHARPYKRSGLGQERREKEITEFPYCLETAVKPHLRLRSVVLQLRTASSSSSFPGTSGNKHSAHTTHQLSTALLDLSYFLPPFFFFKEKHYLNINLFFMPYRNRFLTPLGKAGRRDNLELENLKGHSSALAFQIRCKLLPL